jgi:glutathione peroxidase
MALYDIPIHTLQGDDANLGAFKGKTLLLVNVASKCGLTPQYEGLERLQKTYGDRGFSVIGFPCNQFMGQEPGTADEIREFCDTNYHVQFPLFEKIDVNGAQQHPIFAELTEKEDAEGAAGDITELRSSCPPRAPSWRATGPRWSRRTRASCPTSRRS